MAMVNRNPPRCTNIAIRMLRLKKNQNSCNGDVSGGYAFRKDCLYLSWR
jgi:hypothetical protein